MDTEFWKYHALGNDYLVFDPRRIEFEPEPEAIRALCDRTRGLGSDGILLGPVYDGEGVPWVRIFNPDGSEAEKSGNGLRIFCLYLAERGRVGDKPFEVGTIGGKVRARVISKHPGMVEVDMGAPSFSTHGSGLATDVSEWIDAPLALGGETLRATFVSMGNPHCVIFHPDPNPEIAQRLGPLVERHPMFPSRTNVQIAQVLDRHRMRIEIWERGAGYTLASGSSSCAAASAAKRLGLVDGFVEVMMPGGKLTLDLSGNTVVMRGPAQCVYEGRLSNAFREQLARFGAFRAFDTEKEHP